MCLLFPSCAYIRVTQCLQHGSRIDRHRYTKRSGRPHGTQLYIPLATENRTLDTRFQSFQNKRFDCFPIIINISRIIAPLHCCNQRPALVTFSYLRLTTTLKMLSKVKFQVNLSILKKNFPPKRNFFLRFFLNSFTPKRLSLDLASCCTSGLRSIRIPKVDTMKRITQTIM